MTVFVVVIQTKIISRVIRSNILNVFGFITMFGENEEIKATNMGIISEKGL